MINRKLGIGWKIGNSETEISCTEFVVVQKVVIFPPFGTKNEECIIEQAPEGSRNAAVWRVK